jgi:hypothetical protein
LLREQPFSAPKRLLNLENEEKIKLWRFQYPHAFISQLWNFFNVLNQEEKCEKIGNTINYLQVVLWELHELGLTGLTTQVTWH